MSQHAVDNSDNNSTSSSSSIGSGPYISDNEVIQCCETENDSLEEEHDEVTKDSLRYISDAERKEITGGVPAGLIYPKFMRAHLFENYPEIYKWINGMVQDGWGFAAYSVMQLIGKGPDAQRKKIILFDVCCVSSTKSLKVLSFVSDEDDKTNALKYNAQLARCIISHIEESSAHCLNLVHGILDKDCSVGNMTEMVTILEKTTKKMFPAESLHMDFKRYHDVSYSLIDLFSEEHPMDVEGTESEMLSARKVDIQREIYMQSSKSEKTQLPDPPMPPLSLCLISYDRFSCTLAWKPPKHNSGGVLKGYIIEKRIRGSDWQKTNMCSAKNTSLTVCDVEEGSTVQFRVRAVNDAGLGQPSTATEPHLVRDPQTLQERRFTDSDHGMSTGTKEINPLQITSKPGEVSLTDDDKAEKKQENIAGNEGRQITPTVSTEFQQKWGPLTYHSYDEKEVTNIRKELNTMTKHVKENLKILLFGPTGHGKSSLGNSFLSGLDERNYVSHMFAVGSESMTVSSGFNPVKILGGHYLIDMPGIFETKAITDAKIEDILSGKVPFYAELSAHLRVKGIETNPPPGKNDVSCVVVVLRYDLEMGDEVRRQLGVIKKIAGKGVISYQLVLTHLDQCDPQFIDSRRLPYMYESEKVQTAVRRISAESGVPSYCISFIKNYVNETEKHPYVTLSHLRVLKTILSAACDQQVKRKDMRSIKKLYGEAFVSRYLIIGVAAVAMLLAFFFSLHRD